MDKEKAQFILHSFRSDGADAADVDFAEALQLAVEDRELGEWLAEERASDAAFATALSELQIPDELRLHILAVMRGEKPSDPALDAEMDTVLCEALSHVDPPEGLRDQILAAMHIQEGQLNSLDEAPENVIGVTWRRTWFRVASIAAAVVLGVFLALQMDLDPGTGPESSRSGVSRITSYDVQHEAGRILDAKFALDVMNPPQTEVNTWLVAHELPAPDRLPAGLEGMKVMGCKKIQLDGDKTAALLCFVKDSGGMVHLVVINNDFIKDAHLPSMDEVKKGDCHNCPKTGWETVRWRDRANTYVLFSKKESSGQSKLIQYF